MKFNKIVYGECTNCFQTFYWAPPSAWRTTGELDFLLQTDELGIVPVEVKSARNVRAKTLGTFMEKSGARVAYILSENDYSLTTDERGVEIRHVPLYAAYCLGENCAKYNL